MSSLSIDFVLAISILNFSSCGGKVDKECAFCRILADDAEKQIIFKLRNFFVMFARPITREGHMLIIPFRHVDNIFGLNKSEWEEVPIILEGCRFIGEEYGAKDYNIIANCGEAAAQTVMHAHFHVILRFPDDKPIFFFEEKLRGLSK